MAGPGAGSFLELTQTKRPFAFFLFHFPFGWHAKNNLICGSGRNRSSKKEAGQVMDLTGLGLCCAFGLIYGLAAGFAFFLTTGFFAPGAVVLAPSALIKVKESAALNGN